MVKHLGDATYVFAVNMQKKAAAARLLISGSVGSQALVLGEDRIVKLDGGAIQDAFGEYGVRLYKIPDKG